MIQIELMKNDMKRPERQHKDDAGIDLFFPENVHIHPSLDGQFQKIGLGVKILFPIGWSGLIRPRSSAFSRGLTVNGTIDRYTGEIFLVTHNITNITYTYNKGDSIAQIIPTFTGAGLDEKNMDLQSVIMLLSQSNNLKFVDKLPKTERGSNGHGSTGNN